MDGNVYTDYNMGFGVLVAGHAHPLVVKAIKEQAARGHGLWFRMGRDSEVRSDGL